MKKKDNLMSNIIINGIYELLLIITPLITAPYIARVLAPDGVGINSYISSLVSYFVMFASLGTYLYATREISRNRDDKKAYSKLFWEIELLTLVSTLICLFLWIILSFLYKEYTKYLLIFSGMIIACFFDIAWLYAGLEKFKYTIINNFIIKIISVVMIFVFVKNPDDLIIYIIINVASHLLGYISMWIFLPKFICFEKISIKSILPNLKNTFIYFIPTIAATLYVTIDKSLIGIITKDTSQNGYYEEATKIISIVKSVFIISVGNVICPRISLFYKNKDVNSIQNYLYNTIEIILSLTIGATFGIISISHLFVPFFFGDGYEDTIIILYFLSPILIVLSITKIMETLYFIPSGNIKQESKGLIIGSITNLILNCCMIPFLGAVGASIASVISEIVVLIIYISYSKNLINIKKIFNMSFKKIISGIIMMIAIYFLNYSNINDIIKMILQIFVGIVIYFLMLFILRDNVYKSLNNIIKFVKKK